MADKNPIGGRLAGCQIVASPHVRSVSDNQGAILLDRVSGRFFVLSDTGALIWQDLSESRTPEQITALLVARFGGSYSEIGSDVASFLEAMGHRGLIQHLTTSKTGSANQASKNVGGVSWKQSFSSLDAATRVQTDLPSNMPESSISVPSKKLVMEAFWYLFQFDVFAFRGFRVVYEHVNRTISHVSLQQSDSLVSRVNSAISKACARYPKGASCLQRSAATAWMLRKRKVPAEVVIGVKRFPLESHAWVEVDGNVVNDHPGVRRIYSILDRWGSKYSSCEVENNVELRSSVSCEASEEGTTS